MATNIWVRSDSIPKFPYYCSIHRLRRYVLYHKVKFKLLSICTCSIIGATPNRKEIDRRTDYKMNNCMYSIVEKITRIRSFKTGGGGRWNVRLAILNLLRWSAGSMASVVDGVTHAIERHVKWVISLVCAFNQQFISSSEWSCPGHDVKLHPHFIVTGCFFYWCVMRPASQRFFIHSCIHLRILIICNLVTLLGTNSLSVLMCRKAVN